MVRGDVYLERTKLFGADDVKPRGVALQHFEWLLFRNTSGSENQFGVLERFELGVVGWLHGEGFENRDE